MAFAAVISTLAQLDEADYQRLIARGEALRVSVEASLEAHGMTAEAGWAAWLKGLEEAGLACRASGLMAIGRPLSRAGSLPHGSVSLRQNIDPER
jgi:hypothetical protein